MVRVSSTDIMHFLKHKIWIASSLSKKIHISFLSIECATYCRRMTLTCPRMPNRMSSRRTPIFPRRPNRMSSPRSPICPRNQIMLRALQLDIMLASIFACPWCGLLLHHLLFLNLFSEAKRRGESKTDKCLRRIMQVRCDGTYLVPPELLEEYRDVSGGGRERVQKMWAESSFSKVGLWQFC